MIPRRSRTEAAFLASDECFANTQWTLVLTAAGTDSPEATLALEHLCRIYWPPLYAFVRRRGYSPEDAQDLTQSFFARLLEKSYLKKADRAKGRFRSFLLTSLQRYLADEWARVRAAKRGGGAVPVPLEARDAERFYCVEPVEGQTPETLYERRWARTLIDQAVARVANDYALADKSREFELLRPFVDSRAPDGAHARVAVELRTTPNAVAIAVHRLRQRYRKALLEEVAQTVESPDQVQEELRYLLSVLTA